MARIRLAAASDAAAVRDIYAPYVESSAVSFEVEPPTTRKLAGRIDATTREYPWLVCETGSAVVGYAAARSLRSTPPYDWTVELSVYVADGARRAGVGTGLYTSLFRTLALQGYYSAYAVTTLPNPASTAFHDAMGFEPVGTFPAVGYKGGEWHDVRWWYRELAPHPADPDPPTPLADLQGDPDLDRAVRAGEDDVDL